MNLIEMLFGDPEIRKLNPHQRTEVNKLTQELITIGKRDDFLSLVPGGPYDMQCHHREARGIGKRLHEIGGVPLMWAVRKTVRRKLKDVMAEHLDHCWKDIGNWQA